MITMSIVRNIVQPQSKPVQIHIQSNHAPGVESQPKTTRNRIKTELQSERVRNHSQNQYRFAVDNNEKSQSR